MPEAWLQHSNSGLLDNYCLEVSNRAELPVPSARAQRCLEIPGDQGGRLVVFVSIASLRDSKIFWPIAPKLDMDTFFGHRLRFPHRRHLSHQDPMLHGKQKRSRPNFQKYPCFASLTSGGFHHKSPLHPSFAFMTWALKPFKDHIHLQSQVANIKQTNRRLTLFAPFGEKIKDFPEQF